MSEIEKDQNVQPEKSGLDEKRKNALLRYVAIMFAVAFVFVLLSLLGQMRDSETTISQLSQSSTSAWQKAENLQENNLELELENQELSMELEALQKQVVELEKQVTGVSNHNQELQNQINTLQQEKTQLLEDLNGQAEEYENTIHAYELLLKLQNTVTPGDQTGNPAAESLIAELEKLESYLGENARKTFENLMLEGE